MLSPVYWTSSDVRLLMTSGPTSVSPVTVCARAGGAQKSATSASAFRNHHPMVFAILSCPQKDGEGASLPEDAHRLYRSRGESPNRTTWTAMERSGLWGNHR